MGDWGNACTGSGADDHLHGKVRYGVPRKTVDSTVHFRTTFPAHRANDVGPGFTFRAQRENDVGPGLTCPGCPVEWREREGEVNHGPPSRMPNWSTMLLLK